MSWEYALIFRRLLLICWSASSVTVVDAIRTCEVHPKDVVVATGDRLSLNCSANAGLSVVSWQLGADVLTKIVVYTAPVYRSDGSIRTPSFVATERGYAVDDTKESEVILEIKQTSLTHAGSYYCTCSDDKMTSAMSAVVVIGLKFSTKKVCNGQPIAINCSILSSEDISYVLAIKESLGKTVARKNGSSSCIDVIAPSCQLTYVIPANESLNETFSCTVNATTNKNIRFSKVLKTSIHYSDDCSRGSESENGSEGNGYQALALPIAITVACVIILMLIAASIVLYRKLKPNKRTSATLYATSNLKTSSEEQQRHIYTSIQLPMQVQESMGAHNETTDVGSEYETLD